MGNVGLYFGGRSITEEQLIDKFQELDLWSGTILSRFQFNGSSVSVQVTSHPADPVLGIEIKSDLLVPGGLGVFFDFPYSDTNKFDAPYVGVWNETTNNTVNVYSAANSASFRHITDQNVQYTRVEWSTNGVISGPLPSSNKFILTPSGSDTLHLVVAFSPTDRINVPSYNEISTESREWWANYWTSSAFIDLSANNNENATELQRRIILSQYLVAVNSASHNPPQGMYCHVTGLIF